MATEVNQNYFAWPQEESSAQDVSQGTSQLFGHGSISFGRFDLETLQWEKWSVFTNDRRHEEFGKFSGLVAKKKAYFEEYFKRIRELKALQQENQQTELNLDYGGDGSDSSQTAEDADHTGSGIPVDESMEQSTAAAKCDQEMQCYDDYDNRCLVNETSASVRGLQKNGEHMRGNAIGRMDMSQQKADSSRDDGGMAPETVITPKRTIGDGSPIGGASKTVSRTIKMASVDIPDHILVGKAIPETILSLRGSGEETCDVVGTTGRSGVTGLRIPSSAALQRPSTRERRPVTRDASRKPDEVTTACRPSTSEKRLRATRGSVLKHAGYATPIRPSTADRRPMSKESAPKQSIIATPGQPSTAERRPITKELATKQSNIATPRRPSTADRRSITKELAPKQPNIATPHQPSSANRRPVSKESAPKLSNVTNPHRPSTADRRPLTKESAPRNFSLSSPHRPSTGERRPTTRNVETNHVSIATSCLPPTDKQHPVTRDGAYKNADVVVTLRRPSTAERRPIAKDVALKRAFVAPPCRPSAAERLTISKDVAPKLVAPRRPSTAEKRPVTRETLLTQSSAASTRRPLTPDRCLTKNNYISSPQLPSTRERRLIANSSTMKMDPKTPTKLRAIPSYSRAAMVTGVTPRETITPNLVKGGKLENISYNNKRMESRMDGKQKSSSFNLPAREMFTSNAKDDRVLENLRKANKERLQEKMGASPLLTGSVKTRVPIPPPPPLPPCRPSFTEGKPSVNNNLTACGRKPKAPTPHWH